MENLCQTKMVDCDKNVNKSSKFNTNQSRHTKTQNTTKTKGESV